MDRCSLAVRLPRLQRVVRLSKAIAEKAARSELDSNPKGQIVEAERSLYQLGELFPISRSQSPASTASFLPKPPDQSR